MKWVIVIGIGIAIVVIASSGRIPGTGRQLAVSDETRTAAALAHIPKYERQEVLARVSDYIRDNCQVADKYLTNRDRFEATWMRQPRVRTIIMCEDSESGRSGTLSLEPSGDCMKITMRSLRY